MNCKRERSSMSSLRLSQANAIIDASLVAGRARQFAPLAVVVLDAGGHLVAFQREDGAGFARFDIASAKAWGALGMGFGTRELAERAARFPTFVAAISTATQGRMVPSPGGVLIRDSQNTIVGAVGISGDVGYHDEACAIVGIEAVGFSALPGSAPE
jgi:uncharacterized protein GlcG (DUF336 family)